MKMDITTVLIVVLFSPKKKFWNIKIIAIAVAMIFLRIFKKNQFDLTEL